MALAHSVAEEVKAQPTMLRPPGGAKLREYQMVGLQWMVSLYNNHLNGILADEMVRSCLLFQFCVLKVLDVILSWGHVGCGLSQLLRFADQRCGI